MSNSAEEFDANVNRLKACEHIADGDGGWEVLRNECPSTAAVARLRDRTEALEEALDNIFMRVSYVNIHGVGEQPDPVAGIPQPVRVKPDEFWKLFQEIGAIAAKALEPTVASEQMESRS